MQLKVAPAGGFVEPQRAEMCPKVSYSLLSSERPLFKTEYFSALTAEADVCALSDYGDRIFYHRILNGPPASTLGKWLKWQKI